MSVNRKMDKENVAGSYNNENKQESHVTWTNMTIS